MYIGKSSVYIVFGTICSFEHPLGVLKASPVEKGELLYIWYFMLVFLGMESGFVGFLALNCINSGPGTTRRGKYGQEPFLWFS